MDKWLKTIDQWHVNDIFWSVVTASVLLAAWMQYIQHGWINPDSVLYFEQARLITLGDWRGAMSVYPWPFYGAAIATVHKLGVEFHFAAQLLNMLFFGIAMAGFLKIIQLAGGTNRAMLAGAFLVFGSQYIVGDVLEMLMRDEGFWAFYLFAIFFFMRFYTLQATQDAIRWQLCIGIAILFRIEGLMYVIFLPLVWLLRLDMPIAVRTSKMFASYSLSIIAFVTLAAAVVLTPLHMQDFGRLNELLNSHLYQELTDKLFSRADIMSEQVLGKYLNEFAVQGLLLTFLYIIFTKIVSTTGFIGIGLAWFGVQSRQLLYSKPIYTVLLAALGISLLSMFFTIIKVFVLSSRYVVPFTWILFIFSAFFWAAFSQRKPKHWLHALLLVVLLLGVVKNTLPKRAGYNYQQDAVAWIQAHNLSNQPVFYDEERMRYYAQQPFIPGWHNVWEKRKFNIEEEAIDYQFIAVNTATKRQKQSQAIDKMLAQYKKTNQFCNHKEDKCVVIYTKHEASIK